jgi:hypothetical protein
VGELPTWTLLNRLLIAYVLTAVSLAACGYLWGAAGFDLLVVGMGWPHVILGFMFYFNKVLKGEGSHRIQFAWLLALTAAIGYVYSRQPITTLIYTYFVFHAFRDEIFIYHQRRTSHRFAGPIFARGGGVLLAAVVVLALVDQVGLRRELRTVEVPVEQLRAGETYTIEFPPLGNSRGRTYYFYLVAPHSHGVTTLLSYAWGVDSYPQGELRVSDKAWPGTEKDLEFQARYQTAGAAASRIPKIRDGSAPGVDGSGRYGVQVSGGHRVGQTFRAEADGLSGIALPLELTGPVPAELKLVFHLESGFFVAHPFAYELGLLGLATLLTLAAVFSVPRGLFSRQPGLRYALPVLFLFTAAMLSMKLGRFYGLISPLFISFRVVFHDYSGYVFSLEKIAARPARPEARLREQASGEARPWRSGYERMLEAISTREGFLTLVVALNLVSFAGADAYQVLHLASGLQYGFDLRYFLYFLVFHVTMSFAPKRVPAGATQR